MKHVGIIAGTLALGYFAFEDAFKLTVQPDKKIIIYDTLKSQYTQEFESGTHYINPFYEKAEIIDLTLKPIKLTTLVQLNDKITAEVTYEGKYKPVKREVKNILSNLGVNYESTALPAFINEVISSSMKSFDSSEVISGKEVIKKHLPLDIAEYSQKFNILIEEGKITKIEVFNQAESNDKIKAL